MFQAFGNFSDCRGCPYSGCADYEDRCIGRFEELISGALACDTSGRLGSGFNNWKSKDDNAVHPACTVRTKRVVVEKVKLSTCHFFVLARLISDAKLPYPRACEILGRRMQLWHFGFILRVRW